MTEPPHGSVGDVNMSPARWADETARLRFCEFAHLMHKAKVAKFEGVPAISPLTRSRLEAELFEETEYIRAEMVRLYERYAVPT